MSRWTEYCTELYIHPVTRYTYVLNVINENKVPQLLILRHGIGTAVNSLKIGKSPGISPTTPIYHVFIDFKKALDRLWHATLWVTMKKCNISHDLLCSIKSIYRNATSAVFHNGSIEECFKTSVGVRQWCILSPCG